MLPVSMSNVFKSFEKYDHSKFRWRHAPGLFFIADTDRGGGTPNDVETIGQYVVFQGNTCRAEFSLIDELFYRPYFYPLRL